LPIQPPSSGIIPTVERDIRWIHSHTILAIIVLVVSAGLVYGAVNFVQGIIERHDEKNAALSSAILAQAKSQNDAALKQLQDQANASAVRDAQQQATINGLIAQLKAEHAALDSQLEKNKTLDAASAAARLAGQVQGNVTASGDNVIADLPTARSIVSRIDTGDQAVRDVTNLNGQLDAQKVLTDDAKKNFENAQAVIAKDKDTLIAQIKADGDACEVKIDKQVRKDEKRGFWMSLASFAAGIFLGHR
jgi:hypothetical protein